MKPLHVAGALAALAMGVAVALWQTPAADPALDALWQQRFPNPEQQPQALAQWRGRPLVVNFWASWCVPCREEMPDFERLRARYRARGVEFVGIAIDRPENVAAFLQKTRVSYPILVGGGAAHRLSRELGNPHGGLPHTLVLDQNGKIVVNHLGRLGFDELDAILARVAN